MGVGLKDFGSRKLLRAMLKIDNHKDEMTLKSRGPILPIPV